MGLGIGLTMLPHCDFVFISKSARLKAPFPTLGVTVEAGNSFFLREGVDWANAAHIRYTAAFTELVRAPANRETIQAFKEKRPADFTNLPNK